MKNFHFNTRQQARNIKKVLENSGLSCLKSPEKTVEGVWIIPFKGGTLSLNK